MPKYVFKVHKFCKLPVDGMTTLKLYISKDLMLSVALDHIVLSHDVTPCSLCSLASVINTHYSCSNKNLKLCHFNKVK